MRAFAPVCSAPGAAREPARPSAPPGARRAAAPPPRRAAARLGAPPAAAAAAPAPGGGARSAPAAPAAGAVLDYETQSLRLVGDDGAAADAAAAAEAARGAAERAWATAGPPAHVVASGRVVAIGDLHGDLQKAIACLELAGVLGERDGRVAWVGGDATVVQLGDVLDRGDAEIATLLLLRELDRQARAAGGAVWMLNGNHESLNVAGDFRYVTPGAFWESAAAAGLSRAEAEADPQALLRARWALYRPGGQMARELARNPTVLVVNGELVFAHGGLLPHHVRYGLQRINDEVAAWMEGNQCSPDGSAPGPPFPAMGDASSVMWNRTFGKERVSAYDRMQMGVQLRATLGALGAAAMVVGHTPQLGGVNAECGNRVWRVDAGMSSGVLGAEPQVLEFSRDAAGRLVARSLRAGAPPAEAPVAEAEPA